MIGKIITWSDNWNRWEATIADEKGNCYFLTDVKGFDDDNNIEFTNLQYTGRDKGNVILKDKEFEVIS